MRQQELLLDLAEMSYTEDTKTFRADLEQFDIVQPVDVKIENCSLSFSDKLGYVVVCSDELYFRKKLRENSTKFGSKILIVDSKNSHEHAISSGQTPIDDNTITALAENLVIWLDFDDKTTLLSSTYTEVETVGDNVSYIYGKAPSVNYLFLPYTAQAMKLAVLGQSRCITQDSSSWAYAVDSHIDNMRNIDNFSAFHLLFKSAPTLNELCVIWNNRFYYFGQLQGKIYFKNSNDSTVYTNLNLLPAEDYLLTIERNPTDSNGDGEFTDEKRQDDSGDGKIDGDFQYHWRLERLSTGDVQSQITEGGWHVQAIMKQNPAMISSAQSHMNVGFGNLLLHNGNTQNGYASRVQDCQTFLKQRYTGEASASPTENVTTYNLETEKRIEFKSNCQTLSQLDLKFRNSEGTLIKPKGGLVKLRFTVDN